MKTYVIAILIAAILLAGCSKTGTSKECTQLVDDANSYCTQFTEEICATKSYSHDSGILRNPIPCGWSEDSCTASDGCD